MTKIKQQKSYSKYNERSIITFLPHYFTLIFASFNVCHIIPSYTKPPGLYSLNKHVKN